MGSLPLPSPRVVRALVAALLLAGVASLPVVGDDDGDDAQVAALAGVPGVDDETLDVLVDVPDATAPPPAADIVGVAPTVPRPRIPKVTIPPVTTPTLPPVTVPSLLEQRAKAACIAAVDGGAPLTSTLADTGSYTAAPDGSALRRVVRSDDPGTWDGVRRLAYQVDIVHTWTSALCVLEGGTVHLAGTLQPSGCCMSPGAMQVWTTGDGLAAVDLSTHPVVLRVHDARGGRSHRTFPGAMPYGVSPDGRRLAFLIGAKPSEQDLLVADIDTGVVQTKVRLDGEQYSAWALRWLPDGSGIGYLTDGLHVLDIATRTRRTLVSENVGQYAWAPGGRLAYTTYLRGEDHGRVFVAAPDGSGAVEVADGPVRHLAWSPQGDRLLLAAGHRNDAYLETVRVDGSERRVVARAAARKGEHWLQFVVNTGWSPDGSRIEFGLIRDPGVSSIAT